MSTDFNPGPGWREATVREYEPFSKKARAVEYGDDGKPRSYWVREEPVPPLPNAPYTVIRAWFRGNKVPFVAIRNALGWYDLDVLVTPETEMDQVERFEVLSEPRAVTAKAVLDRVDHDGWEASPEVWREFGVTE